jgi:hypothetical protein
MGVILDGYTGSLRDDHIIHFQDPHGSPVVPIPTPDGYALIHARINEDSRDAYFWAELCEILPQLRPAVALHLLEKIGTDRMFIMWGIEDGCVVVATNTDLVNVTETTAALRRSLARLSMAIIDERDRIVDLAQGKRVAPPSRMEAELDEIIRATAEQPAQTDAAQHRCPTIDQSLIEQLAGGQTMSLPCSNDEEYCRLQHELKLMAVARRVRLQLCWNGTELTVRVV